MNSLAPMFAVLGMFVIIGSMVWLIVRGFRDCAFPDVLLFLMGISVVAYVFARWDRAKAPVLLGVGGVAAVVMGSVIAAL